MLFAGTRVKVSDDAFREPDVLYIPPELRSGVRNEYAERVALVVEVVSESNRDHDTETKRVEYADADIPEYWIVDPEEREVTVLSLVGDAYATHGVFAEGSRASSVLLPNLSVDVTALLAE